jgi:hypothetical protein
MFKRPLTFARMSGAFVGSGNTAKIIIIWRLYLDPKYQTGFSSGLMEREIDRG